MVGWYLQKLSFSITEFGRQLATSLEDRLPQDMRIKKVWGASEAFVKRWSSGILKFIRVKLSNSILLIRAYETVEAFVNCIKERFEVLKSVLHSNFNFNGRRILHNEMRGM